ncbi:MAG TPA: glutamyl-tRNA reductase [Solirubrobacteraceae bacterium]
MTKHVLVVGVSHRTARLDLRERLALDADTATALLRELVAGGAVDEAVALSTCNRTELYLAAGDADAAEAAAVSALARCAGLGAPALRSRTYVRVDGAAARHLFSVASGLDSMILGEAQILGQLKRSFALAEQAGTTGPVVERLVREAISGGRRVRERTAVGRASVSVSSAAVELARASLGDLAGRRVLVVGAGKSGELTAQALASHGVEVVVLSRCPQKAAQLASGRGVGGGLEELARELALADVVLSATSAPQPVISRADLVAALRGRGDRPLLVIDLAVPRDVDPAARGLPGLTLLDLDDVQRRVDDNLRSRRAAAGDAEKLAADEAARFERWRASLGAVATVSALRQRADAIVDGLLADNATRWEGMTDADRERVEALARAVASRLLDEPTRRLKASASDAGALDVARALFGLAEPGAAPQALAG